MEKYLEYLWMNFKVPGRTLGQGKPLRRCLDMYEGVAYCRWGDPTFQSHLETLWDLKKPKQLSQMAFY